DGLKFCNECGAAFKRPCALCGFENAPTAKFCGQCGARINAESAPSAKRSHNIPTVTLRENVETPTADHPRGLITSCSDIIIARPAAA
ncbi:MAG: zinc ribbon domain-containing protein, partial [Deltaproteobacteria bacterium]|nr:zinc ribbon domain-containing protein [Deltaproteobacteria bacterium]